MAGVGRIGGAPPGAPERGAATGAGLLAVESGALPPPESPARTRLIRIVAVSALAISAVYLLWRAVFTIDPAAWFVAIPMWALEAHHAFGLAVYTFSLWDVEHPSTPAPVLATDLKVALLVPTYDESIEVLFPVVSAAVEIAPDHETWVLDDGNRPRVAKLAADLGANYLARSENIHAKAGNLNNALEHIDADVIAVVDADHVVLPGFLTNTLGYFDDPNVAVVQTPQAFYNVSSFEHDRISGDGELFNEQSVFYRVILPAKNHWDAVFWCGTGALVRVEALEAVGGVATESITEDIHTSIKLHKDKWSLVAHNEVLARGLAAADARQYMLQRERWARGAMQVMKRERLLTSSDLTFAQRVAYAATLFAWFDALRSFLFVMLPAAVLFSGVMPFAARPELYGPMFLGTFFMQFTALRLLARGHYPPLLSVLFEVLRMPAVVPALTEIVRPGNRGFKVTPKGRRSGARSRIRAPRLLTFLLVVSGAALIWAVLTLSGLTSMTYANPGAMIGAAVFLAANVALITVAVRRIRDERFAGERRASVRFPVSLRATVDGRPAQVVDLSLTGAKVELPGSSLHEFGPPTGVDLHIAAADTTLRAAPVAVRLRSDGTGLILGLQFVPGQRAAVRSLTRLLFHGAAEETRDMPPVLEEAA